MPELPEVQTTVNGLNRTVKGRTITHVWTDYNSAHKMHAQSIKNPEYFSKFKRLVIGSKIISARRRAKNILIDLSNGETILIHMKMTGHLMYGTYSFDKKRGIWTPAEKGPLEDPYNQFLHLVFSLDDGKHLVFSDVRKFAKVSIIETDEESESVHLKNIGPEPLNKNFTYSVFKERLAKRPLGTIKQVLMDQSIIAGIGNIYSDEILWLSGVHPLSKVSCIPDAHTRRMYRAIRETLNKGIDFGGDSTSDYRNIRGERGSFQAVHNAYRMHTKKCKKRGCQGVITRIPFGGRGAHFCPVHQKLFS